MAGPALPRVAKMKFKGLVFCFCLYKITIEIVASTFFAQIREEA